MLLAWPALQTLLAMLVCQLARDTGNANAAPSIAHGGSTVCSLHAGTKSQSLPQLASTKQGTLCNSLCLTCLSVLINVACACRWLMASYAFVALVYQGIVIAVSKARKEA